MRTEERNPRTRDLDLQETETILRLINQEDQLVPLAVAASLKDVARAVDAITDRLVSGGHLTYIGAGTSGRLGILDAVECPPTFGVEHDLVRAVVAGGSGAFQAPIEGAEDSDLQGMEDLLKIGVTARDAVVGIAASGKTPYTCGAITWARQLGALTVSISCNPHSQLSQAAEIAIEVDTGPEAIAGSTRMKAGSAQKLILNMISTGTMIRLGHVFDNLMVNVHLKNRKLRKRGIGIIVSIAGVSEQQAEEVMDLAADVPTAIVMLKLKVSQDAARILLTEQGSLRKVLGPHPSP